MITTLTSKPILQVKTTYMNVNPDIATQWLEGNVRNRRIDPRHVDILAQDMEAGKWRMTHQGIAFSDQGILVDGQHRLWAILQSGCTIRMAVSFGISVESVDAIDGMKARTVVDRMRLNGLFGLDGVSPNHTATLREMIRSLSDSKRLAYYKEVQLMDRHINAVQFATAHVATKTKGIAVGYVRGVIARAWYSVDHDELAQFCRVLSTGVSETPWDGTIIKLRNQLMVMGSTRNRTLQKEVYGKVERVLTAWLNGENPRRIYPITVEQFMLPEEVVD
jgi:hypothetical protein